MITIETDNPGLVMRSIAYGAAFLVLACVASIWLAVVQTYRVADLQQQQADCAEARILVVDANARLETVRELVGAVQALREVKGVVGRQ